MTTTTYPVLPTGSGTEPPRRVGRALPPAWLAGETPYQRLPRTLADYTWWRLLLAGAISGFLWLFAQVAVVMMIMLPEVLAGGDPFAWVDRLTGLDAIDVPVMLLALLSLAVAIPALWFGMWVMRLRPVSILSSVVARLRWRFLARCALYALGMMALTMLISLGLDAIAGVESVEPVWTPWSQLWLPLLVIVTLVPFQAAAEEYIFRGFLVQALGSWLPRRRWALAVVVVVPTVAFVLSHGYGLWGQVDVAIFALAAMWLTLRTGGLEAAIALHVVNNLVAFIGQASGLYGSTVQELDGGSLIGAIVSALTMLTYLGAVEWTVRRWGIATRSAWPEVGSTPPVPLPAPLALPVPGAGGCGGPGGPGAPGSPPGPVFPPGPGPSSMVGR